MRNFMQLICRYRSGMARLDRSNWSVESWVLCITIPILVTACAVQPTSHLFHAVDEPRAVRADAEDLGYLLAQSRVVAESPLPHERPRDLRWSYRIIGVTEQGNCVEGCPRSTIYVVISNYDSPPARILLYRVDGIRFWQFGRVKRYQAASGDEPFLAFTVTSRTLPQQCYDYEITVGASGASLSSLGRSRHDLWCS